MAFVASTQVGEQTYFGTFDVESADAAKEALLAQLESDGVSLDKKPKVSVEGSVSPDFERLQNSKAQLEAEQEEVNADLQSRLDAAQDALDNAA